MPTAIPSFGPGEAQPLSIVTQSNSLASSSASTSGCCSSGPVPTHDVKTPGEVALPESISRGSRDAEIVAVTPHVAATQALAKSDVPLHRIGDVRQQQGLSLRTIARRTGLDSKELRRHEDPCCDLPLSILRKWQEALEVPVADLLEDDQSLSRPVKERAKMVRIMKTAVSLKDACQSNVRLARLAGMLCDQLLDLMPELKEVGSWPQTGSRRGADVMGRIFHEPISVETPDHE